MFGMWEENVAVGILTGLTWGTQVTTGWYNELQDIETGTEERGNNLVYNLEQMM